MAKNNSDEWELSVGSSSNFDYHARNIIHQGSEDNQPKPRTRSPTFMEDIENNRIHQVDSNSYDETEEQLKKYDRVYISIY